MKPIYMVVIAEPYSAIYFVNKTVYDWITSKDKGFPKGQPRPMVSWIDTTTPECVKEYWEIYNRAQDRTNYEPTDVLLTHNKYHHERAMFAYNEPGIDPLALKEAMNFKQELSAQGFDLIECKSF